MARQKFVLVKLKSLKTLMEWCSDAIDSNNQSDAEAAKAFRSIDTDIWEQVADFGCKHGVQSGSICHECGKIV